MNQVPGPELSSARSWEGCPTRCPLLPVRNKQLELWLRCGGQMRQQQVGRTLVLLKTGILKTSHTLVHKANSAPESLQCSWSYGTTLEVFELVELKHFQTVQDPYCSGLEGMSPQSQVFEYWVPVGALFGQIEEVWPCRRKCVTWVGFKSHASFSVYPDSCLLPCSLSMMDTCPSGIRSPNQPFYRSPWSWQFIIATEKGLKPKPPPETPDRNTVKSSYKTLQSLSETQVGMLQLVQEAGTSLYQNQRKHKLNNFFTNSKQKTQQNIKIELKIY